jgi:hypothetical protein
MFQTKVVEKIKKNTFNIQWLFFVNRAAYEIMWKNITELGTSQMAIWLTCISCGITEVTNTISQCAIRTAFPLQQWLHESHSMFTHKLSVLFEVGIVKLTDPMCMWIYKIVLPLTVWLINWFFHSFAEGLINQSTHGFIFDWYALHSRLSKLGIIILKQT